MEYILSADSQIVSRDYRTLDNDIFSDINQPINPETIQEKQLVELFNERVRDDREIFDEKLKKLLFKDLKSLLENLGLKVKSNLSKEEHLDILRIYLRSDD